jgi:hypothetical protein
MDKFPKAQNGAEITVLGFVKKIKSKTISPKSRNTEGRYPLYPYTPDIRQKKILKYGGSCPPIEKKVPSNFEF